MGDDRDFDPVDFVLSDEFIAAAKPVGKPGPNEFVCGICGFIDVKTNHLEEDYAKGCAICDQCFLTEIEVEGDA